MQSEILLFGPMKVGKSSVAKLLAKRLNLKHVRIDELRQEYFAKLGIIHEELMQLEATIDEYDFYRYCSRLELPMMEAVLSEHQNCIFDCGGGNAVYSSDKENQDFAALIAKFPNSFLLLPAPDLYESMMVLNERAYRYKSRDHTFSLDELKMNSDLIKFHLDTPVANHVIYNADKTPEEVCDQIICNLILKP